MSLAFSNIFRTVFGTDIGTESPEFTLVYYSASWCAPCKAFTPILRDIYENWKANEESIEVIFVSADRSRDQFDLYSAQMPWQALPFSEKKKTEQFKQSYKLKGIPSLLVFDRNGELVTTQGRSDVLSKRGQAHRYWRVLQPVDQ